MLQTLFVIPDWLFHGWLTLAWLIIGAVWMAWLARSDGWMTTLRSALPLYLAAAAIVHWVLPRLSTVGVDPANPGGPLIPEGLAVRGYGLCLMLAILLSIGMVQVRGKRAGMNVEQLMNLCIFMVIAGLVGARLFYVIQKWSTFGEASLIDLVDMTKGGLVVYGSLIGGLLAVVVFCRLRKLPLWPTLDVLTPAMLLGLAIGRIGCLLNGCCYGGECGDRFPLGLRFPAGSAPYMEQLAMGSLLGIAGTDSPDTDEVETVGGIEPGSPAAEIGLVPGEKFVVLAPDELRLAAGVRKGLDDSGLTVEVRGSELGIRQIPLSVLPRWSRPVHPTQVYAALNAGLLCLLLWFLTPHQRFSGENFATMIVAYPASRFLEEMIRQDEAGIFGTPLTISQWISLALLGAGLAVYLWRYAAGLKGGRPNPRGAGRVS